MDCVEEAGLRYNLSESPGNLYWVPELLRAIPIRTRSLLSCSDQSLDDLRLKRGRTLGKMAPFSKASSRREVTARWGSSMVLRIFWYWNHSVSAEHYLGHATWTLVFTTDLGLTRVGNPMEGNYSDKGHQPSVENVMSWSSGTWSSTG